MRVTLSASIAGPIRVHCAIRFAMVMMFMGTWEAPDLGIRPPPPRHTPALSHPKEPSDFQAHAAREGTSSG